jgi:hypothetical protein
MRSPSLALVIAATLAIGLAGCGKSPSQSAAETAVAAATGGKVHVDQSGDKSQVTISTDEGTATVNSGTNLAMPKDFPSDVHLPSGKYSVTSVMQMGPATVVSLHTAVPVATEFGEYDTAMKAGGWKEVMAVQSSNSASALSFQKDQRVVSVSVESESDGTNITLQHVVQKAGE